MDKEEAKPRNKPQVEIVEQPRNTRFRYGSEKKLTGSFIRGSTQNTYPSIRIKDYRGPVKVSVSCVTKDPPYKPHPHKLFNGKDKFKHGVCCIRQDYTGDEIIFETLTVECVSKKNMTESLSDRAIIKIDPFNTGYDIDFNEIQVNCVRLCFQVTLESPVYRNISLDPIVSDPVFNSKGLPALDICWLTRHSATVAGGSEMCVLCEKVTKNDIEVRFYHEESNWDAVGRLIGPSVFKQVAIVFETPEYKTQRIRPESIKEPLEVKIQLRRPSDGEIGDPRPFLLLPLKPDCCSDIGDEASSLKRKREKYKRESSTSISQALQAAILKNRDRQLSNVTCEVWELPPLLSSMKTPESYKSKPSRIVQQLESITSEKPTKHYLHKPARDGYYNIGLPPKEMAGEVSKEFPNYKSANVYGDNDVWIQDLLDVIKEDLNSSKNGLNSKVINTVAREPDAHFFTLSFEASSGLANMVYPNNIDNSTISQLDQFFHADHAEGSSCSNDLDSICFSDLIPDINYEIQDYYSNINDAEAVDVTGENSNAFEKLSDNINKL